MCSFKQVGLGHPASVGITCSATATEVYACYVGSDLISSQSFNTSASSTDTFSVRNGQASGSLEAFPAIGIRPNCAEGLTLYLESMAYTNVTISGQGATANVGSVGPVTLHLPVS